MTSSERPLNPTDGGKYVLIVGQEPTQSSPSLTLSKALIGMGVAVRFGPVEELGRLDWLRILRCAKAVVWARGDPGNAECSTRPAVGECDHQHFCAARGTGTCLGLGSPHHTFPLAGSIA